MKRKITLGLVMALAGLNPAHAERWSYGVEPPPSWFSGALSAWQTAHRARSTRRCSRWTRRNPGSSRSLQDHRGRGFNRRGIEPCKQLGAKLCISRILTISSR